MVAPLIVSRPDNVFRGILVAVLALLVVVNYSVLFRDSFSLAALVPLIIAGVLILAFQFLTVKVFATDQTLTLKLWPFSSRELYWTDISHVEHTTGNPIFKAGGYGYRIRWKEVAYAVSGPQVFRLRLKTGHTVTLTLSDTDAETFRGLLTRHNLAPVQQ